MKSQTPSMHVDPEVIHRYPLDHWQVLQPFIEGGEQDPKHLFRLADDVWDAWPYAQSGRPTEAAHYRFHFGHLRSFLKPYVKWYCYQRLIGSGKSLSQYAANLPNYLRSADSYLLTQEIEALDALANRVRFAALWESLVKPHDASQGPRPRKTVMLQLSTRAFWEHLRVHFGSPEVIPPYTPHVVRKPVEQALDEQQLIPLPVIRQLLNRLALHRDGRERLNRYHHLRLCVLALVLCLGRRIDEVLAAPRGQGPDGPLRTYPAKGAPNEHALWFQFSPNKQGPHNVVYISPEWQDLVLYCVRSLCIYSDEIRDFAPPAEQPLLILISAWNWTAGRWASFMDVSRQGDDLGVLGQGEERAAERSWFTEKRAQALSQSGFRYWLNGRSTPTEHVPGVLEQWKVTEDGSAQGAFYYLRTHQARHTRHSALAKDSRVSLLTRQKDLNHRHPDMQFAYQHTLREQQQALLEKAKTGALFGPATTWLRDILNAHYQVQQQAAASSPFLPGHPVLLNERWRTLIAHSPHFFQFNRVPCGYCTLPQGPEGCMEYMNCLEATDEGCQWFATDPENEKLFSEIQDRVSSHKLAQKNSLEAGHVVQAHKYEVLSRRAEGIQEEVLRRSSQDLRERLKARKQELERDQSHATTNES